MYYTNYKKKNGQGRNQKYRDERQDYFNNRDFSYRGNGDRSNDAFIGRSHNDTRRYDASHRNHGGYQNESYDDYYSNDGRNYRDRDDGPNFFERAGERIKEGWNTMMRGDDYGDSRLSSRHNHRQPGYDNGEHRSRPHQDEEYGYRHPRASHGYAGDNRTYDYGYDRRNDEYRHRRDGESNRYNANSSNDDYYTGYREFDRNSDSNDDWRGRYF